MTIRTVLATMLAALFAVSSPVLLGITPAAHAAECSSDPVTAVRGKDPLCDTPNGRTFTLLVDEAAPGDSVRFSGSGFVRDAGGGQTLSLKLNDVDIIGARIEADADGNVSGSVTLPDIETFRNYQEQYGSERWWVRVLVGSGRADGQDDAPAASLSDEFTLTVDLSASEDDSDTDSDDTDSDTESDDSDDSDTTTTSTTNTSGTLPKTGIEDHPVALAVGLLALVAAAAFGVDRRMRRRSA
jgi:LPXTG-motif cell wall-anchored protein